MQTIFLYETVWDFSAHMNSADNAILEDGGVPFSFKRKFLSDTELTDRKHFQIFKLCFLF